MKQLLLASALALGFGGAAMSADLITVPSAKSGVETMDALQAAVEGAGATIFARVDHAGGAEKVGMELAPTQVLIFGNPKLGTPAMLDSQKAGLFLPMKVLVHEDGDGKAFLTYEDPAAMLTPVGVPADAEYVKMMTGALAKLTAKAAE